MARAAEHGVTARVDHADHGADMVDAFSTAVSSDRCPGRRHRPAPPQPGRQAGHGQRRPAAAARARRPGARGQARRGEPLTRSPGSSSRPSRSPTRRCSTSSASTSRGRCARSSSCTPTTASSGSGRRTPTRPTSPGSARSRPSCPATTRSTCVGLRRLVSGVLAAGDGGAGASFGGMLDVDSAARHRLLPLRGRLPRRAGPPRRPAGQRPARRSGARPGAVLAATCSTSGPATRATSPTPGARR